MKYLFKSASGAVGVALSSVLTATAVAALSGCAPYVAPANELSASANDERCLVLGSNLPSRKCRTDATILSPGALENRVPGGQVQPAGQK